MLATWYTKPGAGGYSVPVTMPTRSASSGGSFRVTVSTWSGNWEGNSTRGCDVRKNWWEN
eukprot:4221985-Pyramimonas_sp.AAC.1